MPEVPPLRDGAALKRLLAVIPRADGVEGWSAPMQTGRVFGGQLLSQAVLAAARSVEPGRLAHAMHGVFLRAADSTKNVDYHVVSLSEGMSYSARRVDATQAGRLVFSATVSFQVREPGAEHSIRLDVSGFDSPDTLPAMRDLFAGSSEPMATFWATEHTFDLRAAGALDITVDGMRTPHRGLWLRARTRLPDDPLVHQAAAAYASDLGLIHVALHAHGRDVTDPGLRMASLDHALWWHRPVRVDSWILYLQGSISTGNSRGFAVGRLYTRDGELVATCAQEGMIRHPADASQ